MTKWIAPRSGGHRPGGDFNTKPTPPPTGAPKGTGGVAAKGRYVAPPCASCDRPAPEHNIGCPLAQIAAADLVAAGSCSGACLVALPESAPTCTCVCGGAYHGALADTLVNAVVCTPNWWELSERGGWSRWWRDEHTTLLVDRSIDAFNKNYRIQMAERGYFLATIKHSKVDYEVRWDFQRPMHPPPLKENKHAHVAFNRFTRKLLEAGRIRQCIPTYGDWGHLTGFANEDEARTAECLIGEAFAGNPCGTVRAIWALDGFALDQLYAAGGNPELAWFPDVCDECSRPQLHDAVDDIYIHDNLPCAATGRSMTPASREANAAYRANLCIDCRTARYSPDRPRCETCHQTHISKRG